MNNSKFAISEKIKVSILTVMGNCGGGDKKQIASHTTVSKEDNNQQNITNETKQENKEDVTCKLCHNSYPTIDQLTKHKTLCPKRSIKCPECDKEIICDALAQHTETCDSKRCPLCNKVILKSEIENHEREQCLNRKISTKCCNEEIEYKTLKQHIEKCEDVLEQCDFCGNNIRRAAINEHKLECKKKTLHVAFNVDELSKDKALELLKKQTTSIGFVAMDCDAIDERLRVIQLRDGAESVYSYIIIGDIVLKMDGKAVNDVDVIKKSLKDHSPQDVTEIYMKRAVDQKKAIINLELWTQSKMTLQQIRALRVKAALNVYDHATYSTIEANEFLNDMKGPMDVMIIYTNQRYKQTNKITIKRIKIQ